MPESLSEQLHRIADELERTDVRSVPKLRAELNAANAAINHLEQQLTTAEHGEALAEALREMIADVERGIRTWSELIRFAADPDV